MDCFSIGVYPLWTVSVLLCSSWIISGYYVPCGLFHFQHSLMDYFTVKISVFCLCTPYGLFHNVCLFLMDCFSVHVCIPHGLFQWLCVLYLMDCFNVICDPHGMFNFNQVNRCLPLCVSLTVLVLCWFFFPVCVPHRLLKCLPTCVRDGLFQCLSICVWQKPVCICTPASDFISNTAGALMKDYT